MKFEISIQKDGKTVNTVQVALGDGSPVRLDGQLAPQGSPFPPKHPILGLQNGKPVVVLPPGMDGHLVKGKTSFKLEDLRAKGHVRKSGEHEMLGLPDGAQAVLSQNGWTITIRPAPASAAKAVPVGRDLPHTGSVAGGGAGAAGLARDIWAPYRFFSDTSRVSTFSRVIIVSLLIHLSIIIFFATRVIVHDPFANEEIPERYAKFIVPQEEEKPEPAQAAAAPKQDLAKAEDEPAAVDEAPAGGESSPADEAAKQAAMREKVKKTGLLAIIGSKGGSGALQDVLSDGDLGGDLDKALEGMQGSGLGVAETAADLKSGGTRGGTGYGTADIGKLDTGGPGKGVGLGKKASTQVKSAIASGEITSVGSLDGAAIASVVKSKISGIKYCYEKELKNNPSLAGKVVVNFTIGSTGEVTAYKVENSTINNAAVEQCILRMVRRWQFPKPSGGEVNVSYPFIFTAQG